MTSHSKGNALNQRVNLLCHKKLCHTMLDLGLNSNNNYYTLIPLLIKKKEKLKLSKNQS